MDHHTRALHFVLYYKAIEVFGEVKLMSSDDALEIWKEIILVYDELLPKLKDTSHINAVQDAMHATQSYLRARATSVSEEALLELKIDLFNSFYENEEAIKYLRKNYPEYESLYPDLRLPVENEGNLEVPVLQAAQEVRNTGVNVIMINDKNWSNFIKTTELKYLEAKTNYTLLHFKDGTSQTYTKNLGEFESFLPAAFIRIHRSYIVNVQFVEKLSRNREILMMKDKTEIPVTKNVDVLLQKLNSL